MKRNRCVAAFILMCVMLVACQPKGRIYERKIDYLDFVEFDGMQHFVTYIESNSDKEEYGFVDSQTDFYISTGFGVSQANEIVENLTESKIVKPKEGVVYANFSATYSSSTKNGPLTLHYTVDGSAYVFMCVFNDDKGIAKEKRDVFKKVSIDSVQFNLYKYDNGQLYGSFMIGTTRVNVQVISYDQNSLKFDWFEFVTLSRNLGSQGD